MNEPADVTLRTAGVHDVDTISDLFLACWRTSYRDVLPPHLIEMYGPASARDLWRYSFADGPASRDVIVAETPDHSLTGVVSMGRDPDLPSSGHVFSLYVHPEAKGLGVGARLMSAAVERLRADGLSQATLWVFRANAGGIAFYQHLGWFPDGGTRVEPEYGETEIRLTHLL